MLEYNFSSIMGLTMMARVNVLLACIFILSKSKLLLVIGRKKFKIRFLKVFFSVNMLFELTVIVGFNYVPTVIYYIQYVHVH